MAALIERLEKKEEELAVREREAAEMVDDARAAHRHRRQARAQRARA